MLLNKDSKPWLTACLVIFAICALAYIPYHRSQPSGPSGGTWMGLFYGIIGTAFIILAMLLTPRKKFRTMRVGRVYWWLQAHVWFGLLSFPVILFHAGFRDGLWGGLMTWSLMILFILIEISGITGLILQNILPGKLLRDVQFETIFEQIDHVEDKLREEAESKIKSITERKIEAEFDLEAVPAGAAGAEVTARTVATMTPGAEAIETFYRQAVVPALAPRGQGFNGNGAKPSNFDVLRSGTPLAVHDVIADLQSIVEERRQLERQRKIHTVLHAWLWIHIPMSLAMLILMVLHAIIALRYHHPW